MTAAGASAHVGGMGLFDRYRVIDADAHVTEPADVWTARVSSRWGDRVPHIERLGDKDVWMIAGRPVGAPGAYSMAGFDGTIPEFPDTYADCAPATYDARARLAHLDGEGLWAQVLYPNVGGFGSQVFLKLEDPELMLTCVEAYNDFQTDWASADARRLIPVTSHGQRRIMEVVDVPIADVGVAGYAIDRQEAEDVRGEYRRFVEARRAMLDQMSAAVAQFSADRTLQFANEPFRRMFAIDPDWIATAPEFDRLLDHMRDTDRVPEVRDFPAWRRWRARLPPASGRS